MCYRSQEIFLPCIKIKYEIPLEKDTGDVIDECFIRGIKVEERKAHRYVPNRYGRMIINMLESSC